MEGVGCWGGRWRRLAVARRWEWVGGNRFGGGGIGGEDYAIGVVAEAVADSCIIGGYRRSCGGVAVKLNWQRAINKKGTIWCLVQSELFPRRNQFLIISSILLRPPVDCQISIYQIEYVSDKASYSHLLNTP